MKDIIDNNPNNWNSWELNISFKGRQYHCRGNQIAFRDTHKQGDNRVILVSVCLPYQTLLLIYKVQPADSNGRIIIILIIIITVTLRSSGKSSTAEEHSAPTSFSLTFSFLETFETL